MEKIFNSLIDNFIKDKVGIATDFINVGLSSDLTDNLAIYKSKLFKTVTTGNDGERIGDSTVRTI